MRASGTLKKHKQFFVKKGEHCYTYPWPHHHHLLLFTTLYHYSENYYNFAARVSDWKASGSRLFSSWIESTRYSLNFSARVLKTGDCIKLYQLLSISAIPRRFFFSLFCKLRHKVGENLCFAQSNIGYWWKRTIAFVFQVRFWLLKHPQSRRKKRDLISIIRELTVVVCKINIEKFEVYGIWCLKYMV